MVPADDSTVADVESGTSSSKTGTDTGTDTGTTDVESTYATAGSLASDDNIGSGMDIDTLAEDFKNSCSIENPDEVQYKYYDEESVTLCHSKVDSKDPSKVETVEYKILRSLGSGVFGHVFKCAKVGTSRKVAIKVMKNFDRRALKRELTTLMQLKDENPDEFHFARAYECFTIDRYAFLIFEALDISLEDYLVKYCEFVPLDAIRIILQQLAKALLKFSELGIIHCDLKPENIVFVNRRTQFYNIKIIDFGNSYVKGDSLPGLYIQTPIYRAPEIILGMKFSEAIDIWSLGCIAAELLLGVPLYPGCNELQQIQYIIETQGIPAEFNLFNGERLWTFFTFDQDSNSMRLKTKKEYDILGTLNHCDQRSNIFNSLDSIAYVNLSLEKPLEYISELICRRTFIDLLKRMLAFDQEKRITPAEVLQHPFITLCYSMDF